MSKIIKFPSDIVDSIEVQKITLGTGPNKSNFSGSYNDLTNKPTIPSIAGLATEIYVDNKVASLVDSSPEALNTLNELAAALSNDPNFATTVAAEIGKKADKSSLATVATSGSYNDLSNKPTVDTDLSSTSTNAVQNKVINTALADKVDKATGKGLSTNDLTTALKTNYDAAYTHSTSTHAPSDAEANVQSDWNETNTSNDAYIRNKPTSMTPTSHASTTTTYGAASATKYGHAKASGTAPKANGTVTIGTEVATFARGDHVHPLQETIKTSNSNEKFYLIGSATVNAAANTTDSLVKRSQLYIDTSNCLYSTAMSAESFNATSDARLKENFEPLVVEKSILDLPTYKFDFIDGAKNQIGCKAQDLQEICPEIVVENDNGYLSIQESKIVYLLLEEVKKLKTEIEVLKNKD